jgi:hypothetical protein
MDEARVDEARFEAEGFAIIRAQQAKAQAIEAVRPKSAAELDEQARKASGMSRADWDARKPENNAFENGFFKRRTNDAPVSSPLEEWNRAALETASQKRAAQKYPVLGDPNSELSRKYLEIQKRLADENSPISKDSNAAERIADMAAAELNKRFEAASEASRMTAGKRYPQFADPNSELTKKYLEIQKRLTEEHNPIMDSSDYPERIADMADAELKITP